MTETFRKLFCTENFVQPSKAYLVPLSLSVQSNDNHGWVHQIAITVEGEVIVLPCYIQHVSEGRKQRKEISHLKPVVSYGSWMKEIVISTFIEISLILDFLLL